MAIAWDHIQLELVDLLGDEGPPSPASARPSLYRSEADFYGRFGPAREPDGGPSIHSLPRPSGRQAGGALRPLHLLYSCSGSWTATTSAAAAAASRWLAALAAFGTGLTALGIEGEILYGPAQVRVPSTPRSRPAWRPRYRELASNKAHDASDRVGPAHPRARPRPSPMASSARKPPEPAADRRNGRLFKRFEYRLRDRASGALLARSDSVERVTD